MEESLRKAKQIIKRIAGQYRWISESAKASLWFIISNILIRGISFFTLPVFSRLLSTEQYGQLMIYSSWLTLISIFATITVWGGCFNTGMIQFQDNTDRYISALQGLGLSIAGFYFLSGIIFRLQLSEITKLSPFLIICMFIEVMAEIPYQLWAVGQRYKYRYKALVVLTVVQSILNPLLGCIMVLSTTVYRAEARIVSTLTLRVVIGGFFLCCNFVKGRCYFARDVWKYMLQGNIVLIPHYLSMQVLSQSDRIMIGHICGEDKAGIYGTAYTFAMLLTLVNTGIESSMTPYIYQQLERGNINKIKSVTNAVIVVLAAVCVGLMSILPDVFKGLLPEDFHPALATIPILAVSTFFMFLYIVFGCIEFYYRDTKSVAVVSVLTAMLNLLLNGVGIRIFGFVAAAYTTLFCYALMAVWHGFIMRRMIRKNAITDIYDIRFIIVVSLIVLLIMALETVLYEHDVIRRLTLLLIVVTAITKKKYMLQLFREILQRQ